MRGGVRVECTRANSGEQDEKWKNQNWQSELTVTQPSSEPQPGACDNAHNISQKSARGPLASARCAAACVERICCVRKRTRFDDWRASATLHACTSSLVAAIVEEHRKQRQMHAFNSLSCRSTARGTRPPLQRSAPNGWCRVFVRRHAPLRVEHALNLAPAPLQTTPRWRLWPVVVLTWRSSHYVVDKTEFFKKTENNFYGQKKKKFFRIMDWKSNRKQFLNKNFVFFKSKIKTNTKQFCLRRMIAEWFQSISNAIRQITMKIVAIISPMFFNMSTNINNSLSSIAWFFFLKKKM